MQQIKKSQYRQRVYQAELNGEISLVYGDGPGPDTSKLLADHDVVELITVTDHIEPAVEPIAEVVTPTFGAGAPVDMDPPPAA